MILALNIFLATCGLVGSVVAIGGETWRKGHVAWKDRVTLRGWVAIVCLFLAFVTGTTKEFVTSQTSKANDDARDRHEQQVLDNLSKLGEGLAKLSLQIVDQAADPEVESARFRAIVRDSGFPEIAERLYFPIPEATIGVNIRAEPSHASVIVGRARPGTALRFLQEAPHWVEVQTPDGTKGWVSKTWVETFR